MTVRRRSRRRTLSAFAARSPLHAAGAWFLRSALIALPFVAFYVLSVTVLVPDLVGFIPWILLIVTASVAGVLAMQARDTTGEEVAGIGPTKRCPECYSSIPSAATVCRYCGHRYDPRP